MKTPFPLDADVLKILKFEFEIGRGEKNTQGIVLSSCRWNREEKEKPFTIMVAVELFKKKGECRISILRVVVKHCIRKLYIMHTSL